MNIRRFLAYLLIGVCFAVVVLFVVLIFPTGDPWTEAELRVFRDAYPALADLPDFDRASEQADGSFLLHKSGEPDHSAVLPEAIASLLHERDLLGLRKSGDDVFFITGGAVDDEWGYVITGDAAVCMDGLWRLERVGNGVFRFSTRK